MRFKQLTTQEQFDWFKERAHAMRCEDTQGIIAYDERGIQAACIFDNFSTDSCHVHLAIDSPFAIRSGFIHEICRHLFCICGRNHFFGCVPANNAKALAFNEHIGLKEVTRIPDGVGSGEDYVILRMDKDSCRWIAQEDERKVA
jgi:hypothetical protein